MPVYRVQGPDGKIHRFEGPAGATPEQIEAAAAQHFGAPQSAPIIGVQPQVPMMVSPLREGEPIRAVPVPPPPLRTGGIPSMLAVYAPEIQTAIRGGQGWEQLAAHAVGQPQAVEPGIMEQNQIYEEAKQRAVNTSILPPRVAASLIGMRENMGHMLNPSGLVGSAIGKGGPILQGVLNAMGFAASQPVLDPQANYWGEKVKQQAVAVPVGALTGALTVPPRQKTPTLDELRDIKTAQYKAVEDVPVPVTAEMRSAIHDQYGREAVLKAVKDAEINQRYGLANEMRALLDPDTRPDVISANAADKISRAFRELGSDAYSTPGQKTAGAGWLARRGKVETALSDVPELTVARRVNTQIEKATKVEAAISLAQDRNTTPGGTADLNQALRREFGKLVGDRDFMGSLTQTERDAIKSVANGTFTANALQRLGKFSPIRNHLSAIVDMAALAGGMHLSEGGFVGAMPAIGMAGLGEAARVGGTAVTSRNAALASELIRSGALSPRPSGAFPGPAPNVPIGNAALPLIIQALLTPKSAQR